MVLSEFLELVRQRDVKVTEAQIRFAIKNGRIPRPRLDGAHRFDFSSVDVDRAVEFFAAKSVIGEAVSCG